MTALMDTPAARLTALLSAGGLTRRFRPAGAADLAEANAVAPLPEPMTTLYLSVDEFRFGEVQSFALADFIEVNEVRAGFGELAEGIFVASDLADGWFFVDPFGFMGLGPGFVFRVERGRFAADDCVPAAESLIDLFEAGARGETPWKGPMLGDRALDRLIARLGAGAGVEPRSPLDPARLVAPGQIALPLRLGRLLEHANGFLLYRSDREFLGIEGIAPVAGSGAEAGLAGALWIGRGPGGRRYAMTTGLGWRDLPAERMLAVAPGEDPARAATLGRIWDIWARWIDEEAR